MLLIYLIIGFIGAYWYFRIFHGVCPECKSIRIEEFQSAYWYMGSGLENLITCHNCYCIFSTFAGTKVKKVYTKDGIFWHDKKD